MIRTTLAAALVATAVTAATTAAQAVPITDFTGLSITLETTPVNSSIATGTQLVTTTGPGSSGPATATISTGVEYSNVRLQDGNGNFTAFDIDILATGLVEIRRTSNLGGISQPAPQDSTRPDGPDMLLDFILATTGTMLTDATLVTAFTESSPDFETSVEFDAGTATYEIGSFEGPGFNIFAGNNSSVSVGSMQLAADGPMASGYGAAAVPLPAGLPFLLTGLAALGLARARRRG
ncbi:hypothetical protein LNKW23_48750 [Paralimibaculum aggregatum]|uniref:VPLPA-CTERM sorting domain-containing protein n=1 Tax=Paralimibaculum aggregatum TaxID=3036245 RepID=A0ABQ6LU95_9RHOB|nr:VPLPA-CTERM sorting domain-containing protein [Limibaculum sp. NKW23]GMG85650.1 hypothetical protein LNKW23_48750 [Limibaculum sp. NKW23]